MDLVEALVAWREQAMDRHPYRAVVTHGWILPNQTITALSKVGANKMDGPEQVSEIADRTEEWVLAYASDIYGDIARFDEGMTLRKLCTQLGRGAAKKARTVGWQNQVRESRQARAEATLIASECAVEEIAQYKEGAKAERRRLLRLRMATVDDVDRMKQRADDYCFELRQILKGLVWDLQERCETLKEVIAWGEVITGVGNDCEDKAEEEEVGKEAEKEAENEVEEEEEEEEEAENSTRAVIDLSPPVCRSSHQSAYCLIVEQSVRIISVRIVE